MHFFWHLARMNETRIRPKAFFFGGIYRGKKFTGGKRHRHGQWGEKHPGRSKWCSLCHSGPKCFRANRIGMFEEKQRVAHNADDDFICTSMTKLRFARRLLINTCTCTNQFPMHQARTLGMKIVVIEESIYRESMLSIIHRRPPMEFICFLKPLLVAVIQF